MAASTPVSASDINSLDDVFRLLESNKLDVVQQTKQIVQDMFSEGNPGRDLDLGQDRDLRFISSQRTMASGFVVRPSRQHSIGSNVGLDLGHW